MLTWDPALYGGRSRIQLPKGKYWKPNLYLTNGQANEESSIYSSGFAPAWLTYQGSVLIIPAGNYWTKCDIETTFYPMDMHMCNFQFVSDYDSTELILHSPSSDINFSDYNNNGEWEIKKVSTEIRILKQINIKNVTIPMFQCSISLKRRAMFEWINSLSPISLMFLLNVATCYVRPDSGERIAFAITLYLSFVFAATALIDRIPNNSLKMPILSYQHLVIIFMNTVGVLWSIYIVHCASKPVVHPGIPNLLLKMILKQREKNKNNTNCFPVNKSGTEESFLSVDDNSTVAAENKDKEGEITEKISDISGLEVANALDTIYFWVVILCIVILSIMFSALLFQSWIV